MSISRTAYFSNGLRAGGVEMEAIRFCYSESKDAWKTKDPGQIPSTFDCYRKSEADEVIARLEAEVERIGMKLRAICPHKKFYEISFEDGYPGGDIATYECEYCGYHFTGELPQ